MVSIRGVVALLCVLFYSTLVFAAENELTSQSSSSSSSTSTESSSEPVYLPQSINRLSATRSHLPVAPLPNQNLIGRGFERLESAAGAEGLAGEPCYPMPCFSDSPRPRTIQRNFVANSVGCRTAAMRGTPACRGSYHMGDKNRPPTDSFPSIPRRRLSPVTPKMLDCGVLCKGAKKTDPYLLKVDQSPLPPTTYASIGGEGAEMARIEERLNRRRNALEAQTNWLNRAEDAIRSVEMEIKHVEGQKKDIQTDLDVLLEAQAAMQLRLRHDQIAAKLNDMEQQYFKVEENKRTVEMYKGQLEHEQKTTQHKIEQINAIMPKPPQYFTMEELTDPEMPRKDFD